MLAQKQKSMTAVMTTKAAPLSPEEALELARAQFGIIAESVEPLDSEKDQNFRITSADGKKYVLKIANPAEDPEVTSLQTAAMLHIAAADPAFPVPRVFPSLSGELEPRLALNGNPPQVVRLISYLEGVPLSTVGKTSAQRRNMGAALARLGLALRGFAHPAAAHEMLWDIKHASKMRPLLAHIGDKGKRALAEWFIKNFEDHAAPLLPNLRTQVIHSDFHPDNILVSADDHDRLAGVIDFGDVVHTQLINDLAIACSYQITEDAPQPLDFTAEIAGAYHKVVPLERAEIGILPDLIAARLVTGVCINGWRASLYPENAAYILSYDAQKWRALERLGQLPREEAQRVFSRACGMV